MRKTRWRWELAAWAFVLLTGTALHFLYQWTGENRIVAAFSPINESVWEHMKLLFVPWFLWSMGQLPFFGRRYPNFLAARAASALLGSLLIPLLFYSYSGAWGKHVLWADLAIFVIAVTAALLLDNFLLRTGRMGSGWMQVLGLLLLWSMAALFVLWTYGPPLLPLFQDPRFGI